MEKNIKIKIPKTKKYIYGRLRGSLKKPLVILVHGLGGNMREPLFYLGSPWFAKKGYSVFRFNLYNHPNDARQLVECTLATHVSDFNTVVGYFKRKGVKRIYAAGHSFGGPTILLSRTGDLVATAMWDAAHGVRFHEFSKNFPRSKYLTSRAVAFTWGINPVIDMKMVRHAESVNWDRVGTAVHTPTNVVVAGAGYLVEGGRKLYSQLAGPKKLTIIKGANHHFDTTDGMLEKLFAETYKWFKKFV